MDELSNDEKDLLLWNWEIKYPALFSSAPEPRYSRRMRRQRRMQRLQARIIPVLRALYFIAVNLRQPVIMTYLTVRRHR